MDGSGGLTAENRGRVEVDLTERILIGMLYGTHNHERFQRDF